MTPKERREQILTAVLPVVLKRGAKVTSKQLAKAAGVAEGTLYKVFGDKDTLLKSIVKREQQRPDVVIDWAEQGGYLGQSLESTVATLIELALEPYTRAVRIYMALGPTLATPSKRATERFEKSLEAWERAIGHHSGELAVSPKQAATLLRSLTFGAATEGAWGTGLSGQQVAQVFLHGVTAVSLEQSTPGATREPTTKKA